MEDIELIETCNEEVRPPKTDFRDQRMNKALCPLCQSELRLIRAEEHSFGEFGLWQCPECGATVDCCNMVDQPFEFHLFSRIVGEDWAGTLRSILKTHGYFPKMPFETSRTSVKSEKENAKLDKLEAQVRCAACDKKFNPAPKAKSILTLEYCAPCRKIPEVREAAAKREAANKAAAKRTRKKTTRRKR